MAVSAPEQSAITEVVQLYIDGSRDGDADKLRRATGTRSASGRDRTAEPRSARGRRGRSLLTHSHDRPSGG